MATRHVLAAKNGFAAESARSVTSVEQLPWKEAHLEAALVLNPALLGVEDHLPISLGGGSTSNTPDLLFVDEVGRPTVVEVKNETAKMDALAQLLGYGLAWGQLPNGEAEVCIRSYTRTEAAAHAISGGVRSLSGLLGLPESAVDASFASAHERLRPLWTWADTNASGLGELARRLFGPHALSLTGVSPRLVLVAPRFDDDCLAFAALLGKREVNLQLVQATLGRGGSRSSIVLDWEIVQGQAHLDRCWEAVRAAWRRPFVRETFSLSAWMDRDQRNGVALAAKAAPEARLWLSATPEGHVHVSSRVPHGWHSKTSLRRKITDAFAAAMAPGFEHDGWGNYSRAFAAGANPDAIAQCVETLAKGLHEHVIPHQPEAE